MDVVLRVRRQLVVEHEVDGRDVQTTRGHVGRDQQGAVAALKLVEGAQAFRLRELAVEGDGGEAERAQQQREPLRRRARRHEDDRRVPRELVAHVREVAVLVLGGDE